MDFRLIDSFIRSRILQIPVTLYKAVIAEPNVSTVRVGTAKSPSVVGKSAVPVPNKSKRKRSGRSGCGLAASSVVSDLVQESSKT